MSVKGSPPSHVILAKIKDTDRPFERVGVAWRNEENGRITLNFSPFIDPAKIINPKVVLSICPNDPKTYKPASSGDNDNGDIPF